MPASRPPSQPSARPLKRSRTSDDTPRRSIEAQSRSRSRSSGLYSRNSSRWDQQGLDQRFMVHRDLNKRGSSQRDSDPRGLYQRDLDQRDVDQRDGPIYMQASQSPSTPPPDDSPRPRTDRSNPTSNRSSSHTRTSFGDTSSLHSKGLFGHNGAQSRNVRLSRPLATRQPGLFIHEEQMESEELRRENTDLKLKNAELYDELVKRDEMLKRAELERKDRSDAKRQYSDATERLLAELESAITAKRAADKRASVSEQDLSNSKQEMEKLIANERTLTSQRDELLAETTALREQLRDTRDLDGLAQHRHDLEAALAERDRLRLELQDQKLQDAELRERLSSECARLKSQLEANVREDSARVLELLTERDELKEQLAVNAREDQPQERRDLDDKLKSSQKTIIDLQNQLSALQSASELAGSQDASNQTSAPASLDPADDPSESAKEAEIEKLKTDLDAALTEKQSLVLTIDSLRSEYSRQRHNSESIYSELRHLKGIVASRQPTQEDDDSSYSRRYEDVSRELGASENECTVLRNEFYELEQHSATLSDSLQKLQGETIEAQNARAVAQANEAAATRAAEEATAAAESSSKEAESARAAAQEATKRAENAESTATKAEAEAAHAVAEKARLEEKVQALSSSLKESEQNLGKLKINLNDCQDELMATKRDLAEKSHVANELMTTVDKLKKTVAEKTLDAKRDRATGDIELRKAKDQLQVVEKDLSERLQAIKGLEADVELLKARLNSTEKLAAEQEDQIRKGESTLELVRKTAAEESAKLKKDLSTLERKSTSAEMENSALRVRVDDLEKTNKNLNDSVQQKQERSQELESMYSTQALKLQQLQSAEPQAAAFQDAQTRARAAEDQLATYERQVIKWRDEAQDRIAECEAVMTRLKAQVQTLADENSQLKSQEQLRFNDHEVRLDVRVREILSRKDEEVARIKLQLEAAQNEALSEQRKTQDARDHWSRIASEKDRDLVQLRQNLEAEKDALRSKLVENERFLKELNVTMAEVETIRAANSQLQTKLNSLQANTQNQEAVRSELERANAEKETSLSFLKSQHEHAITECQRLSETLSEKEAQVRELTIRFEQARADFEEYAKRCEARISELVAIKILNDREQAIAIDATKQFNYEMSFSQDASHKKRTLKGAFATIQALVRFSRLLEKHQRS